MSTEAYELYATALAEFEPADVRGVLDEFARRKRGEFEPRWPELGDLLEPLRVKMRRQIEGRRADRERREQYERFWHWLPEQMERTGQSEEEILDRFPSYRGTKPR